VLQQREKIDGKECHVLLEQGNEPLDRAAGTTDPNTRWSYRKHLWVKGNVVLRQETLAEFLGDRPPRPMVVRRIMSVRDLKLNPSMSGGLFELPSGIACEVFGDYPTRLPEGVKRLTILGPGLSVDGGGDARDLP
jgi:hypothetical protein